MPTLPRASTVAILLAFAIGPASAQQGTTGSPAAGPPATATPATPAPSPGATTPPRGGKGQAPAAKGKQDEKARPGGKAQPKAAERDKAGDRPKAAEKPRPPLATRREETLADCMKYWDKGTHMTKEEWRATCVRQLANERSSRAEIERQGAATKAAEEREFRGKARTRN